MDRRQVVAMIIKFTIGSWRFTFSMAPITKVVGVNSILPDGRHILMWDFDGLELNEVVDSLFKVKFIYNLPRIYIVNTGSPKHYHAYCFKAVEWRRAVEILAATDGLDWDYFKYGIYRGMFTLRVTPKDCRDMKLVGLLESTVEEDVKVKDLKSFVKYETLRSGYKSRKVEVKIFADA